MTQRKVTESGRATLAPKAAGLRATGLTWREVAERLGISRSYAAELASDPTGTGLRERHRQYAERHAGACVDCGKRLLCYNAPGPPERCAGCDQARKQDPKYWAERGPVPRRYTDEQLLGHIRRCHAEQGRASAPAYLRYKKDHPEAPTTRSLAIRFGSWAEAVTRAGFTPASHRRGPGRFPPEVCIGAVRAVAQATGERPSYRGYADFRKAHPELGLPSEALVRGQFDNSWVAAVEAALNDASPAEARPTSNTRLSPEDQPIG